MQWNLYVDWHAFYFLYCLYAVLYLISYIICIIYYTLYTLYSISFIMHTEQTWEKTENVRKTKLMLTKYPHFPMLFGSHVNSIMKYLLGLCEQVWCSLTLIWIIARELGTQLRTFSYVWHRKHVLLSQKSCYRS